MDKKSNKKKQNKKEKLLSEKPNNNEELKTLSSSSNNIIQLEQIDNKFHKRQIISNWSKYEDNSIIVENKSNDDELNCEQTLAADFEKLLHMPAAVGSHFIFRTEKLWDNENSNIYGKFSEIFCMNLSLLQEAITSIPFNIRLGYSNDIFSKDELELFNIKSLKISEQYKMSLSNFKSVKKVVKEPAQILKDKNVVELFKKKYDKNIDFVKKDKQIESSIEFSALENKQKKENKIHNQSDISKEDKLSLTDDYTSKKENKNDTNIQQWLDDILDI